MIKVKTVNPSYAVLKRIVFNASDELKKKTTLFQTAKNESKGKCKFNVRVLTISTNKTLIVSVHMCIPALHLAIYLYIARVIRQYVKIYNST